MIRQVGFERLGQTLGSVAVWHGELFQAGFAIADFKQRIGHRALEMKAFLALIVERRFKNLGKRLIFSRDAFAKLYEPIIESEEFLVGWFDGGGCQPKGN